MIEVAEVFERIRVLYNFKNLTELSLNFDKTKNWAGQMCKRNTVPPYEICDFVRTEKQVSMDWLLYGDGDKSVKKSISQKEFVNNIKESFYECWELKLLPNYPKEEMPVISTLFVKNFKNIIEIEMNSEDIERKKKVIL